MLIIAIVIIILHVPVLKNFFVRVMKEQAYVSPAIKDFGILLTVTGMSLAVWARVFLGKNWGFPRTLKQGHELVTSGPYTLVRHPIYAGMLVALFGSALVVGIIWLFPFVVLGVYFVHSAKVEEKLLTRQFPDQYPNYMKRTKMLIPFLF